MCGGERFDTHENTHGHLCTYTHTYVHAIVLDLRNTCGLENLKYSAGSDNVRLSHSLSSKDTYVRTETYVHPNTYLHVHMHVLCVKVLYIHTYCTYAHNISKLSVRLQRSYSSIYDAI